MASNPNPNRRIPRSNFTGAANNAGYGNPGYANPGYVNGSPCVYVGATGLTPEERFANHKAGHKANWYAQTYGEVLLPNLFVHLNPMTRQRALATEITLAEELRQEGFAVWQN